jgi:hypothetical protein
MKYKWYNFAFTEFTTIYTMVKIACIATMLYVKNLNGLD